MWQYLRSLIFVMVMYVLMALIGVLFYPVALYSQAGAFWVIRFYCRLFYRLAEIFVGLKIEVRGEVPQGQMLVCSKHQSFLDVLIHSGHLPRARYVMKSSLKWAPIIGQYGWRIGCVPVTRGRKEEAVRQMLDGVKKGEQEAGQLLIYPQGTRVAPGVKKPYKKGAAVLYELYENGCVPVATNGGLFWPRYGILKKPGVAVLEYLPAIPPGLPPAEFMARLEKDIEEASDRLAAEGKRSAGEN